MTSLERQAKKLLYSKQVSITNPRRIVLSLIIKENRPLTIEQLLHLANGKLAESTVYRVVNDLNNCGLIVGFTTQENTLVVELKKSESDHQYHIFCENCGRIIDIELDTKLEAAL